MLHLISFPPETVNPVKADIRNPLRYLLITVKIIHRGSYFSESSTCEPIRSQKSQNCKQKFSLFFLSFLHLDIVHRNNVIYSSAVFS